ncbi:LysM peptidoglycan-binding domain-containing protein [Metabacillus malikii]|uniref:LysM repeat protein n=1 Tax=Metabacillus malikii TaxID=1504265 RepID=A0ABT9ZCM8_9BACI|nr:LysM peptidoglycan-binding domain-containing protein [Metabacillus malikii]MDQ0229997.1 LysM repeat protein [Metabacillus malikii]
MEYFKKIVLKKDTSDPNQYFLEIHLDELYTEFAAELGESPERKMDLLQTAKHVINRQYPHLKVNFAKVLLGGIVISTFSLVGHTDSAKAAELPKSEIQSAMIYYEVTSGDTLWKISQKFNTTVDNIKRANHLSSDTLKVNQELIIPKAIHTVVAGDYLTVLAKKYSTTVDAIKQANKLTNDQTYLGQQLIIPLLITNENTNATSNTLDNQYTVAAGDSLSVIAKRFNISVDQLRTLNQLTSDTLRIGQVLTIPVAHAPTTEPIKEETEPNVSVATYTVVAGDSLSVIAKRYSVSVDQLRAVNQLTSDILKIGQVLTIPEAHSPTTEPIREEETETNVSTYTVVAGDSLWSIAQNNGTTVDQIRTVNNLTSTSLQIGQKLIIPSGEQKIENKQIERETFVYSIQPGDSLSGLAKRFDVTIDSIRMANRLSSDQLFVGQALTIPDGLNKPSTLGTNTVTFITHTVASGDTIWDLSIKYGIPQTELLRTNNLSLNSRLTIGQKLQIPVHNIATKEVVSAKHGEYLDWWTEAQYIFTIGKTAKVTDFSTGKSFYIQRTVGANHADSETLTSKDTEIAKSIWGGFSWTPRAVILEIDGRKIAASMSFMPHEREYIKDNGITGHFDVYFANSTRHVDGKADSSHQTQVEKAAGQR